MLGTQIKIIDANEKEVPNGEAGELAVLGPQVMQGYWNKPKKNQQTFTRDGYFKVE